MSLVVLKVKHNRAGLATDTKQEGIKGPKARFIAAWGNAPRQGLSKSKSAESAIHIKASEHNETGFQPLMFLMIVTQAVGLG